MGVRGIYGGSAEGRQASEMNGLDHNYSSFVRLSAFCAAAKLLSFRGKKEYRDWSVFDSYLTNQCHKNIKSECSTINIEPTIILWDE